MSAFTEPLAQVRLALEDLRDSGDRPGMYDEGFEALAALDRVERLAADMETELHKAVRERSVACDWAAELAGAKRIAEEDAALLRAFIAGNPCPKCGLDPLRNGADCEWCWKARAVLSAREEQA